MDIIGLALSFAGAIIIFIFGLPPRVSESGATYLITGRVDEGEVKKAKKYKMVSRVGLILLAVGFLLQLLEKII